MEYTEEEKRELERQEVEFKRRQDDALVANDRGFLYGWQFNEPKTTEEWRKLALSLSDSLQDERKKKNDESKKYEEGFDKKVDEVLVEVDGFARSLSYLLSNSVCGQMTHRNRDQMARHALFAVERMAEEFKGKLCEAKYGNQIPF